MKKKEEKKKHLKDVVLSVGAYRKALPTSCFIKQWLVADKIEILNHPYYATELHLAKLSINGCLRFTLNHLVVDLSYLTLFNAL